MKNTIITYDEKLCPLIWTDYATCIDLKLAEYVEIQPMEIKLVWTWVKTNFANKIYIRSSTPLKKWLILANSVAIIDEDYTWEIKLQLLNITRKPVKLEKYERIAQLEWNYESIVVCERDYDNWTKLNPSVRGEWWFWSTWNL